jgi:8-oxo-dGTP pyrophosphatase MutT (NUDIX family)
MLVSARDLTPDAMRRALATTPESRVMRHGAFGSDALPAAVIVPIRLGEEPAAILVVRAAHLREHASEVGFPGGKPEASDADLFATARREMHEEVGLSSSEADLLGQLTPVPVISGRYLIHPFVVRIPHDATAVGRAAEVERVVEAPLLPWMHGERRIRGFEGPFQGRTVVTPHFELDRCVLYGASALIFYELLGQLAHALGTVLPEPLLEDRPPWGERYGRS